MITSNIDEVKKLREQKNQHFARLNEVKEKMRVLEDKKSGLMANFPRNYHSVADL